jgi:hypothetical protein
LLTNDRTIERVTFTTGGSGFTPTSTVNGCSPADGCPIVGPETPEEERKVENVATNLATVVTEAPASLADPETRDDEPGDPARSLPEVRMSRLIDLRAVRTVAPVTEPVAGDGNPALWIDVTPPAPAGAPGGGK